MRNPRAKPKVRARLKQRSSLLSGATDNNLKLLTWKSGLFSQNDISVIAETLKLRLRPDASFEAIACGVNLAFQDAGDIAVVIDLRETNAALQKKYDDISKSIAFILAQLDFPEYKGPGRSWLHSADYPASREVYAALMPYAMRNKIMDTEAAVKFPMLLAAVGNASAQMANDLGAGRDLSSEITTKRLDSLYVSNEAKTYGAGYALLENIYQLFLWNFDNKPRLKADGDRNLNSPALLWCKELLKFAEDRIPGCVEGHQRVVLLMVEQLLANVDVSLLARLSKILINCE